MGAIIQAGKLHANIAFPGLTIEYQVSGGNWLTYQEPIAVSGQVNIRSRSTNGLRASRITQVQ